MDLKSTTVRAAVGAVILLAAGIAGAAEPPSAGADLTFSSAYLWRGTPLNAEAVLWPDVWVSGYGFTATFWGSLELTDDLGRRGRFTEVDYTLEYARTAGPAGLTLGFIRCTFPNTDYEATSEVYGRAGLDLGLLEAAVTGYRDVEAYSGTYATAQVSRTFAALLLESSLSLSLGYGDAKHNEPYYGAPVSGFTDLTATLDLAWAPPGALGDYLTLTGSLGWSRILDDRLAAGGLYAEREHTWGGLGISVTHVGE
ncbi:MAG: hypothetical protein C4524_08425 [Candidatus Zixiibacteriota bacterium]|nr:MAG: hypothetical protein C4524_08425 [candidate division Zixibacteria bacterium]